MVRDDQRERMGSFRGDGGLRWWTWGGDSHARVAPQRAAPSATCCKLVLSWCGARSMQLQPPAYPAAAAGGLGMVAEFPAPPYSRKAADVGAICVANMCGALFLFISVAILMVMGRLMESTAQSATATQLSTVALTLQETLCECEFVRVTGGTIDH